MKTIIFNFFILIATIFSEQGMAHDTPVVIPVPNSVAGVKKPVVSLNGTWKFTTSPRDQFWLNSITPESWQDIQVPGEALMQGFNIKQDVEYPYKREIQIPDDFKGKRIFIQFDGVYCYTRVWINGTFVRDHHGGFTTWNCEITDQVVPGGKAWITVGVTDRSDDISYGSKYSHHNMGGILFDVRLIALPSDPITRFHAETVFDETYTDATLRIHTAVDFTEHRDATVMLSLEDPSGNKVALSPESIHLTSDNAEKTLSVPIMNPLKWDAEHPNLYRMTASLKTGDEIQEVHSMDFGFREVKRKGNKVYVNGKQIILRGVNRHMAHPLLGRAITPELDRLDVVLYKAANVNFIRTSHYPPTRAFLQACDQYGMYVEEESAVAFAEQNTSHNPEYEARYLGQFAEMVERDRDHPCVILWSLGNESYWGVNFQKCYDYVKIADPSRLVVFSLTSTVPAGVRCYDVYQEHYCISTMNMGHPSVLYPVLHGEFAHVGGNYEELQRDPGVRDFWGHIIRRYGENFFTTDGCLGGGIWGSIDDIFFIPDMDIQHPVLDGGRNSEYGFGEWGCLIDGWRRKKPEYWHTKKAYSPVRIQSNRIKLNNISRYGLLPLCSPGADKPLAIPVANQFDHTNLKELRIEWTVNDETGYFTDTDIPPREQGELLLPARNWKEGDVVHLHFFQYDTLLIDVFELPVGMPVKEFYPLAGEGPGPRVSETADGDIVVKGSNFRFVFSQETGLITEGSLNGKTLITGGPYLNLTGGDKLQEWTSEGFTLKQINRDNIVVITNKGSYGEVGVVFEIRIDGAGLMKTKYTITRFPLVQPQLGYEEVGVMYELTDEINRLTWERDGLWSAYPETHIGRNKGEAYRTRPGEAKQFREKPNWPWSQDMIDFFLFGRHDQGGRGTRDFRSMKTDIWFASAILGDGNERVRVESDRNQAETHWVIIPEQHAVRLSVQQETKRVLLHINNAWNYPQVCYIKYLEPLMLKEGPIKYKGPLDVMGGQEGEVTIRLTDNDEYDRIDYLK